MEEKNYFLKILKLIQKADLEKFILVLEWKLISLKLEGF